MCHLAGREDERRLVPVPGDAVGEPEIDRRDETDARERPSLSLRLAVELAAPRRRRRAVAP